MSAPVNFEAEAEAKAAPPWAERVKIVPSAWYTTPPKSREWLLKDARTEAKEGVFPLGKVGLLAAEGGAGKTMAGMQLARAVATRTKWLGTFEVATPGKVLVILGEEDADEIHRRIYRATRIDEAAVPPEGSIVTLALAGIVCPMIDDGGDGAFLVWLRKYVADTGPYALIIIDPVSRFYGADAERDNAAATRFCQALESLVAPSGGASIIASHHVNKNSRGSGATVDASSARGSGAFTDGVRWVSTIAVENIEGSDTVLRLAVVKSNYAKKPPPVELRYGDGGVLLPLDDAEREKVEQARDESDPQARKKRKKEAAESAEDTKIDAAVIASVEAEPRIGAGDLRTNVKARARCGPDKAATAIARVLQAGRIRREKVGKSYVHYVVEGTTGGAENAPVSAPVNGRSNGIGIILEEENPLADV